MEKIQFLNQEPGFDRARAFLNAMSSRRSIRQFSQRAVPRDIIYDAIRTAATAPSGANAQPWYFAVIESQPMKDFIRARAEQVEKEFYGFRASTEWLNDLKPLGTTASKSYLSEAPYLIAVFSRKKTEAVASHARTYYPIESTGIAVGLLLASLHLAGLATLTHTPNPMQFLNDCLDLDSSYKPYVLVVAGYPAETSRPPDLKRKSFEEVCGTY